MLVGGFNIGSEYLSNYLTGYIENPNKRIIWVGNSYICLYRNSFTIMKDGGVTKKIKYGDEHKIKISIESTLTNICSPDGLVLFLGEHYAVLGGSDNNGIVIGKIVLANIAIFPEFVHLDITRDYIYFAESVEAYIEKVHHVLVAMSSDPQCEKNSETFDMMMTTKPAKGAHRY